MRIRKRSFIGIVGEDGELVLNWDEFDYFLSMYKGKSVIIHTEILPTEISEKTRNYFFGYCVPEMQNVLYSSYGERYTKEQTYNFIRRECPLFAREERVNGEWKTTLLDFESLDQAEMNEVIDWLYQYAAENFSKILELPKK